MFFLRCCLLLLEASFLLSAAAGDLTIKVEVPNVTVDVFVTDRKGHHVRGLSKEQFTVLEDNVQQEIVSFKAGRARLAQPPQDPVQPSAKDERTAAPLSQDQPAPQNMTLLIDLGGLQPQNLKIACTSAAQYVEKTLLAGQSCLSLLGRLELCISPFLSPPTKLACWRP